MINYDNISGNSWKKVHEFLLQCGSAHDPKALATEVLTHIRQLCEYDQALVYFFDVNGKICNQHLVNIDERWSTMYLEYYSKTDSAKFNCLDIIRENSSRPIVNMRDWEREVSTEFVPNYIRLRNLKYSMGFSLYDLNGIQRTVIALDRTENRKFTAEEIANISLAIPHLNNLHKNLYYQQNTRNPVSQISWEATNLTAREIEVANLLCQGISPANISRSLYISPSTTYKHISHIYEKLHVSSQQELLVRLLG